MENTKKTIAMIVSGLDDSYNEALCRGVHQACEESSYNLIILPGSYINRELDIKADNPYAYQFNTIYDFLNASNISGIIIAAGSIGCYTDEKSMLNFINHYKDIPMVLVSSNYSDYTCINYDNSNGVRDGVEYLVNTCECKKFGVLRGPSGNTEMVIRFNSFMEVMKKYGFEITDDQILDAELSEDNHEACRAFLRKNKDLDAIVCANDFSALDLCDEIKRIGKTPGKEIKVLGYDNTVQGAKADPPLATISADPNVLGHEAVSYLELKMMGKKVDSFDLPAMLILRETLGVNTMGASSSGATVSLSEMSVEEAFNFIFYRYRGSGIIIKNTPLFQVFSKVVTALKSLRGMNEISEETYSEVTSTFAPFVANKSVKYGDIDNLIAYTEQLRMDAVDNMEFETQVYVEYIYQDLYKMILSTIEKNNLAADEEFDEKTRALKKFVQMTGNVQSGDDANYSRLISCFQWIGARNGYIYVFDEPRSHTNLEPFKFDGTLNLKAFLQDGSVWKLSPEQQKISVNDIFSNDFIGGNRCSMVMLPLYVNKLVYGFFLVELTDLIFPHCEFLSHQISLATKLIQLLKK